jgi:hypothetical protein
MDSKCRLIALTWLRKKTGVNNEPDSRENR